MAIEIIQNKTCLKDMAIEIIQNKMQRRKNLK